MYTAKPQVSNPALSSGTNRATLRRSWWTIPEADRLEMHAFTRLPQQLRLMVRDALLRSLRYSSLYMRLIIGNKEKGARTKIVSHALHTRLTYIIPKEGITLLKFIYDQFHKDKLGFQQTSALSTTCMTLAYILPENARTTNPSASAATVRRADNYTPQSAKPQREAESSTMRKT
jgi:hypothetical protein